MNAAAAQTEKIAGNGDALRLRVTGAHSESMSYTLSLTRSASSPVGRQAMMTMMTEKANTSL